MGATGRLLLAGLLGALAMMAVNFALHRPPMDSVGWGVVADGSPVRPALAGALGGKPGLYVYPALDLHPANAEASQAAYDAAAAAGPSGILIYHPAGRPVDLEQGLAKELVKALAVATLAAVLLVRTTHLRRYAPRVAFVAAIGAIAAVSTHTTYHAFYGFPADYTAARIATDFAAWLVAALVIAAVAPPPSPPRQAASPV